MPAMRDRYQCRYRDYISIWSHCHKDNDIFAIVRNVHTLRKCASRNTDCIAGGQKANGLPPASQSDLLAVASTLGSRGVGAVAAGNNVLDLDVTREVQIAKEHLVLLAQRAGDDGEGVGDAVLSVAERKLGDGGQRSDGAVGVALVHGVGTGGEGHAGLAAVGRSAGLLAVHHVGGDGKDRGGGDGVAIPKTTRPSPMLRPFQ